MHGGGEHALSQQGSGSGRIHINKSKLVFESLLYLKGKTDRLKIHGSSASTKVKVRTKYCFYLKNENFSVIFQFWKDFKIRIHQNIKSDPDPHKITRICNPAKEFCCPVPHRQMSTKYRKPLKYLTSH